MTKGYRVTFTVGQGFDKDGKRLDNVIRNMDLAKRQAAEVFGGFSLNLVDGGWFNDQGEYVGEPSARFEVIVSEDKLFSVDAFAVYLRLAFNQASVLVTREPVSFEFIEAGERTSHIVSYQQ